MESRAESEKRQAAMGKVALAAVPYRSVWVLRSRVVAEGSWAEGRFEGGCVGSMAGELPRVWVHADLATGGGRASSGGGASCAGGFVDGSKVTAVVGDVGDRNVAAGDRAVV